MSFFPALCSGGYTVTMYGGQIALYGDSVCFFGFGPRIDDDEWHAITLIYDGNGAHTLYVDYAFAATITQNSFIWCSAPPNSVVLDTDGDDNRLGSVNFMPTFYRGALRNLAFYDYAITSAQAETVYMSE
jgi:hypothetical protein